MMNRNRIRLAFYNLFSIVTFNKYYICESCNKIHKRTGNEFALGGRLVYVSIDCANATIEKACKALREGMMRRMNRPCESAIDKLDMEVKYD